VKKTIVLSALLVSAIALADQIPVTLTGYEFSSDEAHANRLAMQSYSEACKDLKLRAREYAGDRLEKLSCGTPIAIVDDEGQVSYSSIATLSFRGDAPQVTSIGTIEGDELQWTDSSDDDADTVRKNARESYDSSCGDWLSEMEDRFGESLLFADCGERENSPAQDLPNGTLAWKYVSHGRVTLASTVAQSQPEAPAKSIVLRDEDAADPEALIKTRDELREHLHDLQAQLQEKLKAAPKAAAPSPLPSGPVIVPPSQPAP
jgi:hypothetical protein